MKGYAEHIYTYIYKNIIKSLNFLYIFIFIKIYLIPTDFLYYLI